MTGAPLLPADACQTMAEVRRSVDALDRKLVQLVGERLTYMQAAARIKPEREAVRDEPRKQQVIANACAAADALGIDPQFIGRLWEALVEESIRHELAVWDRTRC